MKKSRRLLSFILTAVMLLGMFAITSSAEGESAEVTIKPNTDIAAAGDVITVTVNVSTNYYATTMRWPVLFSNDFFELVDGTAAATDELLALGGSVANPAVNNVNSFTSDYTSDEYSSLVFQWQGLANGVINLYNVPEGMDCFTFQLKVKDDAPMGSSGDIVIGNKSLFYTQMLTDPDDPKSYKQNSDIVFTDTPATVSFPVPEILAVEGSGTVIDRENGLIRGINPGVVDNLNDYLYAKAPGELVVTPSQDNRMGTGTKVELVLRGEVLETYTVIVAGDVSGDCLVDATDYVWYDLAETYDVSLEGAAAIAADITADGTVDVNDKIALDSYLVFAGEIDQATGTYAAY